MDYRKSLLKRLEELKQIAYSEYEKYKELVEQTRELASKFPNDSANLEKHIKWFNMKLLDYDPTADEQQLEQYVEKCEDAIQKLEDIIDEIKAARDTVSNWNLLVFSQKQCGKTVANDYFLRNFIDRYNEKETIRAKVLKVRAPR